MAFPAFLDVEPDKVDYRIREMRRSFPDATVTGYESLIESMTNDPEDRHVLAAAIRALHDQTAADRREPTSVAGLLGRLERSGLQGFAADVRRHLP